MKTVTLNEKDIYEVKTLDNGLIRFWIRTKRKAEAVYNCYDRNGIIISDALIKMPNGVPKTFKFAIYHLSYKYCAVKLM